MDDASQRSRMAPSVVVWGLLACLVGSLVGSLLLPLALTTIELLARSSSGDDSPLETWGHVFELSPFWRRTFDPVAFGYDALVFGFLAVAAARAAAGGRGAP